MRDARGMERALAIRARVFIEEQGVPVDEEVDEHDRSDPGCVHALAFTASEEAVGTGRFYEARAGCAQIGRMAVVAEYRRRGIGAALLEALLAEALRRGYRTARLLAQEHAVPLYASAGFRVVEGGAPVWDAGILHLWMEARLAPSGEPRGTNGGKVLAPGRKTEASD